MSSIIKIRGLTKIYKIKGGDDVLALDNVNLEIGNVGMTAIVGESGSGKSTLLNAIGLIIPFDSGDVSLGNYDYATLKERDKDDIRRNEINYVFQEFNLIGGITVEENLRLEMSLAGKKDVALIDEALERVSLIDVKKKYPYELSGGEQQRVAIARAIVKGSGVLLADEPTGNLDSENSREVFELLKETSRDRAVIVVTHDIESARAYADRIVEMKDGEIISDTFIGKAENKDTYNDVFENKDEKKKRFGALDIREHLLLGAASFKSSIRKSISAFSVITLCFLAAILFLSLYFTGAVSIYRNTAVEAGDKYMFVVYEPKIDISLIEGDGTISSEERLAIENEIKGKKAFMRIIEERFYITREKPVNTEYYDFAVDTVYVAEDNGFLKDSGYTLLAGKMPAGRKEIAITKYQFDGLVDTGKFRLTEYEDVIGVTLEESGYTVVGVVDTYEEELYRSVKDGSALLDRDDRSFSAVYLRHRSPIVSEQFLDNYSDSFKLTISFVMKISLDMSSFRYISEEEKSRIVSLTGEEIEELGDGEMVIGKAVLDTKLGADKGTGVDGLTDSEKDSIYFNIGYGKEFNQFKVVGYIDDEDGESLDNTAYIGDVGQLVHGEKYMGFAVAIGQNKGDDVSAISFLMDNDLNNEFSTEIIGRAMEDTVNYMTNYEIVGPMFGIAAILFMTTAVIMNLLYVIQLSKTDRRRNGVLRSLGVGRSGVGLVYTTLVLIMNLIAFLIGFALSYAAVPIFANTLTALIGRVAIKGIETLAPTIAIIPIIVGVIVSFVISLSQTKRYPREMLQDAKGE